ncbi:MAG: imelysin family protein [Bacteroidota bacterium]
MNLYYRITISLLNALILTYITSCDDSGEGGNPNESVDQQALLQNLGENFIIPAYQELNRDVTDLQSATTSFVTSPEQATLAILRNDFISAYKSWQYCSMLEFGPADAIILRGSLNIYPTDNELIESNIESGNYNLDAANSTVAKGFPAIDYLLYGTGADDSAVLTYFSDTEKGTARLQYLNDVVSDVASRTSQVLSDWSPSGGNYMNTFATSTGTSVGSSLGQMVNAFLLDYERFVRDGKVGIPAGIRSAGVPRPGTTEAFYSGISIDLAVESLEAYQRMFQGNSFANDASGQGFDDYLKDLDREQLSNDIINQLELTKTTVAALDNPLSATVENDNQKVQEAYAEMQKLVVLMKVDMASALGVLISYQDNDGD